MDCCCTPKPCPNCGYCPCCGRGAGWPYYQQPYNPWNPWAPPYPGPVWIGYTPTTTGVTQSTPDCTFSS